MPTASRKTTAIGARAIRRARPGGNDARGFRQIAVVYAGGDGRIGVLDRGGNGDRRRAVLQMRGGGGARIKPPAAFERDIDGRPAQRRNIARGRERNFRARRF